MEGGGWVGGGGGAHTHTKPESLKGSELSEVDGSGPVGEEMLSATNQAAAGKKKGLVEIYTL